MAKKRPRDIRSKINQLASSLPEINPDEATLGPESSLESTGDYWIGRDTTNAPQVGKEEEKPAPYARGSWELLDKFLHGEIRIPPKTIWLILTLLWFGFISWLYLQDNQANRISNISGVKWFCVKAAIYSGFYIIVSGIIYLFARFRK